MVFFFLIIILAGCAGPYMTLMIHPVTGERRECLAGMTQHGAPIFQQERTECVSEYRAVGFIAASELTAEQRKTITPRATATTIKIEK